MYYLYQLVAYVRPHLKYTYECNHTHTHTQKWCYHTKKKFFLIRREHAIIATYQASDMTIAPKNCLYIKPSTKLHPLRGLTNFLHPARLDPTCKTKV